MSAVAGYDLVVVVVVVGAGPAGESAAPMVAD